MLLHDICPAAVGLFVKLAGILKRICCHRFKATLDIADGITMGHLKENSKGVFSSFNLFGSVPDTDAETLSLAARKADVFIVVNASTIELLDVEKYVEETIGDRPLVLWNLELDTLRADLGKLQALSSLTAFVPKGHAAMC